MSPPRPILKRAPRQTSHAVHFPSSPILTRTFPAHSPTSYDRTPILVEANACALPARGCPGRTYTLADDQRTSPGTITECGRQSAAIPGKHVHPRAVALALAGGACPSPTVLPPGGIGRARGGALAMMTQTSGELGVAPANEYGMLLPPLIPDLSSSESEESDGFASPPVEAASFPTASSSPSSIRTFALPSAVPVVIPTKPHDPTHVAHILPSSASSPTALSFLPHPPSPPDLNRHRRRREKPRNPSGEACSAYKRLDPANALASCTLEDQDAGCLAGF